MAKRARPGDAPAPGDDPGGARESMWALVPGADRRLSFERVPLPALGPGDVLVRVSAAGVNRADLSQLAGHYPPPPGASEVLGLEVAGHVAALGPGLTEGALADPLAPEGWRVPLRLGEPVCALLPGGGYAEYATVPAAMLIPQPPGWAAHEAGAWPEAAFTAYLNLFLEAGLQPGERLLVHGGASGVGSVAIQLAKAAGAVVCATAGGPAKVAFCRRLGADHVSDRHAGRFEDALRAQGVDSVDVVLDMVGGDYFAGNLGLLRTGGRLVVIATLGGSTAVLDLRLLMLKRLRVIGSTLRARPPSEKVAIKRALLARFGPALRAGELRPVIDTVAPWGDVADVHERMRDNRNSGKLVLEVTPL